MQLGSPITQPLIKDAACVVVSVAYRLAPENPYPAALDDAIEALQWVHNKGQGELGVNINKIAIGGSSRSADFAFEVI